MHKKLPVQTISFGPNDAWFCSMAEDGAIGKHHGLPTGLSDKLDGQRQVMVAKLPAVDDLSVGYGSEEWIVRFKDGSFSCGNGVDPKLKGILKEDAGGASSVLFGRNNGYTTSVALMKDGSGLITSSEYIGLPNGLLDALKEAHVAHQGVQTLAMGPDGEFFLKAADGTFWRSNLHPSLDRMLDELAASGSSVGW